MSLGQSMHILSTICNTYIEFYIFYSSQSINHSQEDDIYSFIIILIMNNKMEDNNQNTEQFDAVIRYHSQITGFDCEQPLSLFQMTVNPYDYYLQLVVCDTSHRVDYYKTIAKMGPIVVSSDYIKTQNSLSLLFYNLFNLGEKDKLKMHMFFKYYNFTLSQWVNTLKNTNGVVAQNDLLYIFKSLLSLAIKYSNTFNQPANVFQSNKIFISIDRRLKIYPFAFEYHGQQIISSYLNRSQCQYQKNKKGTSLSTSTFSMRRIDSENQYSRLLSTQIDSSLRDILLIILQMLTFKGKDYFFSRKHNSVIWDSVRNVLNIPNIVGYLSQQFVLILKEIVNGKLRDMNKVLERVEAVIEDRGASCVNLSMKSSMEALQVKQMVVCKDRSDQIKNLKSKLAVSPFLKKLRQH